MKTTTKQSKIDRLTERAMKWSSRRSLATTTRELEYAREMERRALAELAAAEK
jgi:hypothetical protein